MVEPDAFRALARSSPWRWRSVRFVARIDRRLQAANHLRAVVRRPGGLRVESVDGTLRFRQLTKYPHGLANIDGRTLQLLDPLHPDAPPPDRRADGLVARRAQGVRVRYDDPMWQDYQWVAMLDPAELADGRNLENGGAAPTDNSPVEFLALDEVVHNGRPAWEATVRPTAAYYPRCSCCALLLSAQSDPALKTEGPRQWPARAYADAHRLVLDLQTGICVHNEEIGGPQPGIGFDMTIEAVDVEYPDELFTPTFHR